jgi:hypothetical protein
MLLDAETTPIVSLAFAQSALMKQVTKITQILKKSGKLGFYWAKDHGSCVIFIKGVGFLFL